MANPREVAGAEACGLDAERVQELLDAAAETVADHPGCACQVALAKDGALAAFAASGEARFDGTERAADLESLFCVFSVTKAIVSSASWILLQEGSLELETPVAEWIPGFEANGKGGVRVVHLLTHQAGFPRALLDPLDWRDPELRLEIFAKWTLEWEPGTRFTYHGTSSMWVLREVVERASGQDLRDFVRERISEPLGLHDLHFGLAPEHNRRVAEVVRIGEDATAADRASSGIDAPSVSEDLETQSNDPERRAVGSPGGGAIATAADIALFYQRVLADAAGRGAGVWKPATLANAFTVRNPDYIDPMTGQPALRGLGVVVAGEDPKVFRGFPMAVSPRGICHMGAGGQVAWADPETGLSFAYVTNGAHRNPVAQGGLGMRLSTLAVGCLR